MSPISYTSKNWKIVYFKDHRNRSPFLEWLEKMRDRRGKARIKIRIDRLERGNFGDTRSLGDGLYELKIPEGPGYRVYFGFVKNEVVLLLCGGDKANQQKDIERAKEYWSSL